MAAYCSVYGRSTNSAPFNWSIGGGSEWRFVRYCLILLLSADEAIAFEDSLNGLKAAKQAGIRCIVVPNAATRAFPFETVGYDGMLDSMSEMPLRELLKSIEADTLLSQQRINPA